MSCCKVGAGGQEPGGTCGGGGTIGAFAGVQESPSTDCQSSRPTPTALGSVQPTATTADVPTAKPPGMPAPSAASARGVRDQDAPSVAVQATRPSVTRY